MILNEAKEIIKMGMECFPNSKTDSDCYELYIPDVTPFWLAHIAVKNDKEKNPWGEDFTVSSLALNEINASANAFYISMPSSLMIRKIYINGKYIYIIVPTEKPINLYKLYSTELDRKTAIENMHLLKKEFKRCISDIKKDKLKQNFYKKL